ncbi:MAG: proprotein convertase P-domain-containing protein, partial [Bacteriovoracaceae bacterium]|nr:proprotein convertase P-domain-containing protein [Bacteriovoracaceae bacterium]
ALAEVGEVKTYTKDGIHTAIPDYNKNGLTSTVTVNDNLIVEQVVVDADIEHPNISELSLEIKSPSGTRSVLMHINTFLDSAIDTDEYDPPEVNTAYTLDDHLLSNAFYGEDARGTWEFKVVDGIKANQGTLNGWRITIYGHHQ